MAGFRRSFRWPLENKKTISLTIPRSESGFGFTVAWTRPPLVDYIHEGGNAERVGLMPGDKIVSINSVKVSKKGKEEIENIVKNVKDLMELEIVRPETEVATRKRQLSLRRKESFTKKGSKMIIQDCNIMLWRRERAVLKLLLCEEELVSTVHRGKERFVTELRKRCNLATPIEINILFGNIEEVACVHERYVQQLKQMTQGKDDSIGKLYQRQLDDRCSVLKTYIYGLHLANTLLKYKMSNSAFREFIENLEKEEGALQIAKFLEKPVQYIADVTLQLETLLSCTAVGHRDYVCLESVVSALQNFGKEMVEAMSKLCTFVDSDGVQSPYEEDDPYVNLETLQEKTIFTKGPRNFSLVHPGRYWLFSGELSKIEGRHYVQYWALLLSDCLILTRRTEQRVLLVLDEPVMLRSIYQATFDVEKCDREFRILFALEKPKKSVGERNQWLTWILRAPSVGIKLLWQTILTFQLSQYSAEALSSGSTASFVHTKPLPGVKELASKKSTRYEESSFVTVADEPRPPSSCHDKEFGSIQPRVGKFILPLTKRTDLFKEMTSRTCKERSYFSLNENMMTSSEGSDLHHQGVKRSKSFGNDVGDGIPFIDSTEEVCQTPEVPSAARDEPETANDHVVSASGTPQRTDRCVQTDECIVRSSPGRKRFPRLGTFERIKIDRNPSGVSTSSARHRRNNIRTTVSKEQLLSKSDPVSPCRDDAGLATLEEATQASGKKKARSLFSRLFRREPKVKSEGSKGQDVQMSDLVKDSGEGPPDYESAVRSSCVSSSHPVDVVK